MKSKEIELSKRTAVSHTIRKRKTASLPIRLITRKAELQGVILHFGCGKDQAGTGLLNAQSGVVVAMEYDPNYVDYPEVLEDQYDIVIANYVLNVLPPKERKKAIKQIRSCMKKKGVAYITVRSHKDTKICGKPEFDGVRTSIRTFQKGYTLKGFLTELRRYFKNAELFCGSESSRFIIAKVKI